MANEIIGGMLLSEDGQLAMVVLALAQVAEGNQRRADGDEIAKAGTEIAGTGLKAELSGVPVMQLEIREAVERDRLDHNTMGFLAGCLIAILFFRHVPS